MGVVLIADIVGLVEIDLAVDEEEDWLLILSWEAGVDVGGGKGGEFVEW